MMISDGSLIKKSGDLLMSVIDNEAVILGMKDGMYVGLNEIGTEIWHRLNEPIRVSSLIETLIDQYNEDEVVIKDHVLEFLSELLQRSLITIVDES